MCVYVSVCMCTIVRSTVDYGRVWAGVSGATISNFRSYHPLIVCLKEVFSCLVLSSSPYSYWPNFPSSSSSALSNCHPPPPFFLVISSLVPVFSSRPSYVLSFFPTSSSSNSHSISFASLIPLFPPLVLPALTCFSWSFSLHQYNAPQPPPSSYPDNHRGPTGTRGWRQDSQSNRSSDQWALYIATVTPK